MLRAKGWRLYVRRDFAQHRGSGEFSGGEYFDGVRGPFEEVAASKYAKVKRCSLSFAGHKHSLYFKQYLRRSWWDFTKHIFRPSRARRAMTAGMVLEANGLRCTKTVAMGEMIRGPVCLRDFLLTENVEDANDIYGWFGTFGQVDSKFSRNEKRKFVKTLGETVGRMHSSGIFHGDLRPGNVLGKRVRDGWEIFFLDNERTKQFGVLPEKLRIKNLVQINMLRRNEISITDHMRFFRNYLKQCPGIGDAKFLAGKVIARTAKRMQNKPKHKETRN